jgi:hypothetical protein
VVAFLQSWTYRRDSCFKFGGADFGCVFGYWGVWLIYEVGYSGIMWPVRHVGGHPKYISQGNEAIGAGLMARL